MQATPAAVSGAFLQYEHEQSERVRSGEVHDDPNAYRYVWYGAEDLPHEEIHRGFITRCRITPVVPFPVWDNYADVPEQLRIRVRPLDIAEPAEAMYEIPPGPIFRSVMDRYEGWGVVELSALHGMQVRDVLGLNIDPLFFPENKLTGVTDEIPRTYREMRARIHKVADGLPIDSRRPVLEQVAADMLLSLDRSAAFDTALVDEAEVNIERSKSDKSFPATYGKHVLRALARLERPRRDKALNEQAENQRKIIETLPQLLKSVAGGQQSTFTPEHFAAFAEKLAAEFAQAYRLGSQTAEKPAEKPSEPQGRPQQGPRTGK